jgi:hypothetical protein
MPQANFQKTKKKLRRDMEKVTARIQKLATRRASLPSHLPLAKARKGQDTVKLSTERKHLTNILKMVAFQIESDLVEMIRPHYKRAEDEGRTLVQTILQDAADIEPAEGELRITLAPLSSPHRSRVVESLCAALNKTNTMFPGTQLQMRFAVDRGRDTTWRGTPRTDPDGRLLAHPVLIADDWRQSEPRGKDGARAVEEPSVCQGENTRPGDRVFLATTAKGTPPLPD